ncbi:MAG: RNA polymerase factor sigma-54 [Fimbriimonadaceae bacterium]
MRNTTGVWQKTETTVRLRVDPKVVLSSHILQLGRHELETAIDTELNDNPALERLEADEEPISEESIYRQLSQSESRLGSEDAEEWKCTQADDREPVDWLDFAADTISLDRHLDAQLERMLPPELRFLRSFLIGSLSDSGYLETPIEEIALAANCSLDEVDAALKYLKQCDPPGIGAQNLQECLLLQLRGDREERTTIARAIVKKCFEDLASQRLGKIQKRFHLTDEQLEDAVELIRSLNPYPGAGYQLSGQSSRAERSQAVEPDIVISRDHTGWRVDVRGPDPASLAINRLYRSSYVRFRQSSDKSDPEMKHVRTFVERAANFIKSLSQRRSTLRKIGEYLIQHQPGFLSTGDYQFLRPLTRSTMAADLSLHESTVSRATQAKHVQIPTGEVVPFEVFFKPALRVQKMIEEILSTENPDNPLSDEKIATLLSEKGVVIARRTVNKYRDRNRLLASHRRRQS